MSIELFHTHSKDFGRDVLRKKNKQTKNKQTNQTKENKDYTMRRHIRR